MAITAAMVKELREMTGAGMMDCKKALTNTDGDMDAAVEFLRENGLAKAAKKAGRIAAEGLVAVAVSEDAKEAAIVEVNSETDFVAKNEKFQTFVSNVANQILDSDAADIDAFMAEPWALDTTNLDSKVGETYNYKRWSSFNSAAGSEIEQDWRDHNNCELFDDYFKNVNLHIAPGTMYSAGVRSDELQLVWTQVTTCIKEGSWKAIYASSDEEFDKIVADMVAQANEYGYDQCVEFQQNEVTLRAAAEDAATEEAAVEVLEEPPQAVIAAVAPTTADAFRKSRREIIFIIMFSFNSYLSIFTGAILHAPVIPVRIIPLQHPTVQENKFTRLKEFFCAISTNAFWARQFLFSKHHNFSYICNMIYSPSKFPFPRHQSPTGALIASQPLTYNPT